MKRIVASMCLAVSFLAPGVRGDEPVRRVYRIAPAQAQYIAGLLRTDDAERYLANRRQISRDAMAEALRYLLHEFDVVIPDDIPVRWSRPRGAYVITASDDLHARIGRRLAWPDDWQVEIEAALISFDPDDLEALSRARPDAAVPREEILRLRIEGQGQDLARIKLLGRSGRPAHAQSGQVVTFAGEARLLAEPAAPARSEGQAAAGRAGHAITTSLVEREVGLNLTVTPTVHPDLRTIDLSVKVESATVPEWAPAQVFVSDGASPGSHVATRVPQFHRQSATAALTAHSDATLVLGGWPAPDDGRRVYLFLTPRIVNAQGHTLDAHDFRGEPEE